MKKLLQIEVEFPDGFVPPEKFHNPEQDKDFNSPCDLCPFFIYEETYGFACLALGYEPQTKVCPIKEQF